MDRRVFLGLSATGFFRPGRDRQGSKAGPKPNDRPEYEWIEDIKHGGNYRLLRTALHVDAVFLSPPDERGGPLRVDFANWKTYPDHDDFLLVPTVRPDPEWYVLGSARHSVSLLMGPRRSDRMPEALIQFESATRVSVYTQDDRVQQVVLLSDPQDHL